MADGSDLADDIGNGQQTGAAGEHVALKICPQSVTHHRHTQLVDDIGKLPDLCIAEELGFINHDTIKELAVLFGGNQRFHVGIGLKGKGRRLQTDA